MMRSAGVDPGVGFPGQRPHPLSLVPRPWICPCAEVCPWSPAPGSVPVQRCVLGPPSLDLSLWRGVSLVPHPWICPYGEVCPWSPTPGSAAEMTCVPGPAPGSGQWSVCIDRGDPTYSTRPSLGPALRTLSNSVGEKPQNSACSPDSSRKVRTH